MRRPLIAGAIAALALVLSGCATSDPTPTTPADSNQDGATDEKSGPTDEQDGATDEQDGATDEQAAGGSGEVLGQVTLGAQAYELTEVIRCERAEDDVVQFDLEVIALGRADDGAFVQLDVYQGPGFSELSWSGPEGLFSSDENATVTVSGDTVTGSGVVLDAETESSSLEMSFDLALPTDRTECR